MTIRPKLLNTALVIFLAFSSAALFASGSDGGSGAGNGAGNGGDSGGDGAGNGGGTGGSDGGGNGGSSGSSDGGNDGGGNGYDGNHGFFSNAYDKGKKIFQEQVVCGSCPFAGTELNQQGIERIREELGRSGIIGGNLSYNQRYNVKHYIKKRFAE